MKNSYDGPERRNQPWHLEKKVTITLIFIMLGQMGSSIWWAADLSHATKENAKSNAIILQRFSEMEARERDSGKLVERVVRVETMLENVQRTVHRIDNALDERPRRK